MKFVTIFTVAAATLPAVLAACCDGPQTGKCRDGAKATPCCATGSCNLFCCACKGHCRTKKRGDIPDELLPRDNEHEIETRAAFAVADSDSSGNVTLDQYLEYMRAVKRSTIHIDWFNKHDKNDDGVITPDEVRLEEPED